MVKDQETESSSVFSYINNYINRYTSLPTADPLVPINPMRLPSYYRKYVNFGSKIGTKRFHAAVGKC